MFKDKKEELRRLEEELLLEAQREEEEARLEEELEEAEALLENDHDYGEETEETYYNFANRYGQVKAYNNDTADEDLEDYSDRVYRSEQEKGLGGLRLLATLLLVAIVFVLGWCYMRFKGFM